MSAVNNFNNTHFTMDNTYQHHSTSVIKITTWFVRMHIAIPLADPSLTTVKAFTS